MNGNNTIVFIAIGLCMVMLCWVLFRKEIMTMLIQMVVGACIIWLLNMVVPASIAIGINMVSLACAGILGIPGVAMVYIIGIIV